MKFNIENTVAHIEALGYNPQFDKIHLTAFLPKGHPQTDRKLGKKADQGRKAVGTLQDLRSAIESWIKEQRGVYIAVNDAHKVADVTQCRAVFCEYDDRSIPEQVGAIASLPLPEPSLQVLTGGKSLHSYWIFDQPIPPDDWKKLQIELAELAQSDPSLKNPNRVMRLAGCPHFHWDAEQQKTVETGMAEILATGPRYEYAKVRAIVPQQEVKQRTTTPYIPMAGNAPKGDDERIRAALMAIPPRRPGTGSYDDSLRVLMALQSYYGADKGLQLARLWSPDEDWGENLDRKMAGLKGSGVNIGTLFHIAKQYGYRPPARPTPTKFIATPKGKEPPPPSPVDEAIEEVFFANEYDYLRERVRDILATAPDDAAVSIALSRLAKAENLSRRDLDGIATQIRGEQETVTAPPSVAVLPLDLSYVVPDLADAMAAAGKANGVDPVMFLHYLLPAVGTLLGSQVKVEISPGHIEPCILWHSAIEDSGLGKTRAYQMIDRWLVKKQEAEIERWTVENRTYKMSLAEWQREQKKQGADNTEPPEPPTPPRRYSVVTATMEALVGAMAAQKGKGVLWFRDELAGLFSSFDQYTKGKSEHLETFLQAYDGGSLNVLRRNLDDCIFAPVSHLCVAGGIQPAMVSKIFSDPNDPQGLQARFQFLMPQAVDRRYQRSRAPLILPGMLDDIFDTLDGLGSKSIALTDDAFSIWADYYDAMQTRAKSLNPAAAAWLRKHASRTARVALALHAIDVAVGRVTGLDQDWIDAPTMERAIALGEFYRAQFEQLQRQSTQDENDLSSLLYRIQQQAQRTGRLTVRQVQQGTESKLIRKVAEIRGWRPSEVIKNLFKQAGPDFEMVTEGTTVALVYKPVTTPPPEPTPAPEPTPSEPPPSPEPDIPPMIKTALEDLVAVQNEAGLMAAIAMWTADVVRESWPHLPAHRREVFEKWGITP